MANERLNKLSKEELLSRKNGQIRRIIFMDGIFAVFAAYIIYLDFIKNTGHDYKLTYIMIIAGSVLVSLDAILRIIRINKELENREEA